MKAEKILQSSMLDLLFENRNKQYGAYELRKNYGFRLKKAVFGTISAALLLFISLTSFKKEKPVIRRNIVDNGVTLQQAITPKEKPRDKPKEQPKPKGLPAEKMKKNPVYSSNLNLVTTIKIPTIDITQPANPNGTLHGTIPVGPIGDPKGIIGGNPKGKDTVATEVVKNTPKEPEKEVIFSQSDAVYPGGREAFGYYLQDKLGDEAIEDDMVKKITVNFTIEKDGSITNITASGNNDASFVNKTVKAFAKMKKWTPAMQNGHAVKSEHQIPVVILPEE